MSKYNVFIVSPDNMEQTIDALNEISAHNPSFNPFMRPHQYLSKPYKDCLKKYVEDKKAILRFDMLKSELGNLGFSAKEVNNQVLSAYLKHKGFHQFKVRTCQGNSVLTLWKHEDNHIC